MFVAGKAAGGESISVGLSFACLLLGPGCFSDTARLVLMLWDWGRTSSRTSLNSGLGYGAAPFLPCCPHIEDTVGHALGHGGGQRDQHRMFPLFMLSPTCHIYAKR